MTKLTQKFLKEHRKADEIIYSERAKMPVAAMYYNPDYTLRQATKLTLARMARAVLGVPNG